MENSPSIERAIDRLHNRIENGQIPGILLEFYRERTTEILVHLEEQGVGKVVDYDTIKLGGTA